MKAPERKGLPKEDETGANNTSAPPRIVLLIGAFYPRVGGGETHARLLARELRRLDIPVSVLTRRHDRDLPKVDVVDGVPVRRLPPPGLPRLSKYLMLPGVFIELIRRRSDYDVVYVCGLRVLGLAAVPAARLAGKKVILRSEACGEWSGEFIYAGRPTEAGQKKLPWPIRLLVGLRNELYLKADRFVAISSVIREEFLRGGIPAGKITDIPNGIDLANFTPPDAETRERLRREFGFDGRFVFAYSGKLNRGKGLEMLLRQWDKLFRTCPKGLLVLIGAGGTQFLSCEDELRAFVRERGLESGVCFTGYTRRVSDYLKASDAFLFPSESEAHPLALIEAMACGLPVLASRVGGIPDIVTDGVDGVLLPPREESAWQKAIQQLLDHPAAFAEMGRRASESVRRRYAIEETARRHAELFRSLTAHDR